MISLSQYIIGLEEARIVPFGKTGSSARFGQCVILAGGPGTGKGFIRQNYLNTDYKTFNVDDLKGLYVKMKEKGVIDDEDEYDFKKPEDVAKLHAKVKEKGWKEKERDRVFSGSDKNKLPNICFDITCKEIGDLKDILQYTVPLGYYVTLVWVVGNVDVAAENNKKRSRTVPESLLRKTHNAVNKFIPELLSNKYKEESKHINAAYVALSAGNGRVLSDEWKDTPILPVKKNGDEFDYGSVKDKVEKFQKEEQPADNNPKKKKKWVSKWDGVSED